MPSYTVTWEVQLDADSPKDAAIEALNFQTDPFNEALCYTVVNDGTKEVTEIDLLQEDPED